jgi:pyrophosphatase PpaX
MGKYSCLFFDMDGTFTDSRNFHVKAFHRFFNKYYKDVDMDTVRKGIGATIKIIFDNLNVSGEHYRELFDKLCLFYSNEVDDLIAEIEVAKGFRTVLEHFNSKAYTVAVITNSLQQLTDRVLQIHGLRNYFQLVIGADRHTLDKQERCLGAMNMLQAKPGEILYIGDAERDIEVANALGFDSCLAYTDISWCEDYKYTLNVLRPTYTVQALGELPFLLDKTN